MRKKLLKLENKLRKKTVAAISDYNLLEESDKVLVGISGGKDSIAMYILLNEIKKRASYKFELLGVMVDQKLPEFNSAHCKNWLEKRGLGLTILEHDTYSVVAQKTKPGDSYCALCSKLRRGILYNYAYKNGFNKIALGQHRDDLNESLLLNMMFNGKIAGMPPKLLSDDKRNIIIRPFCYLAEADIMEYVKLLEYSDQTGGNCKFTEERQRNKLKQFLLKFEKEHPGISNNLLAAQKKIRPAKLMDQNLWDFDFSEKDPL